MGVPNQTEKFYQITIRELGPLWFDSLKLHVVESVIKKAENDLVVFRKYLAKYHPIRKQFNNHFKNALYKLAEGDSKTALNKIIEMETLLVKFEGSPERDVFYHFWGILKSFTLKSQPGGLKLNPISLNILFQTKRNLQTPEWYIMKAILEYPIDKKNEFKKDLAKAQELSNKRRSIISFWKKNGLHLDTDLTSETNKLINLLK